MPTRAPLPRNRNDEERPSDAESSPTSRTADAVPILMSAIEQMDTEDCWVPLGSVGYQLANLGGAYNCEPCRQRAPFETLVSS